MLALRAAALAPFPPPCDHRVRRLPPPVPAGDPHRRHAAPAAGGMLAQRRGHARGVWARRGPARLFAPKPRDHPRGEELATRGQNRPSARPGARCQDAPVHSGERRLTVSPGTARTESAVIHMPLAAHCAVMRLSLLAGPWPGMARTRHPGSTRPYRSMAVMSRATTISLGMSPRLRSARSCRAADARSPRISRSMRVSAGKVGSFGQKTRISAQGAPSHTTPSPAPHS